MKLFFAGTESTLPDYGNDMGIKRFLISLANFKIPEFKQWCSMAGFEINNAQASLKQGKELFLDCGAFSIKAGNSKLTFYDYIDFLQRFGKTFHYVAAFDVIPDPEKTMSNYKDMLRLGFSDCIPTYHYPEPIEYFDQYCKMTDYVALGGIARLSFRDPPLTSNFIQRILNRKPPHVKLHLFGIASNPILKKFGDRIESVDSTSWLGYSKYTNVLNRYAKSLVVMREANNRRHTKDEILMIQAYNIRRYQELENDINTAIKLKAYDRSENKTTVTRN